MHDWVEGSAEVVIEQGELVTCSEDKTGFKNKTYVCVGILFYIVVCRFYVLLCKKMRINITCSNNAAGGEGGRGT